MNCKTTPAQQTEFHYSTFPRTENSPLIGFEKLDELITDTMPALLDIMCQILLEYRAAQYNRGLIAQASIEHLCQQIARLPYVESQSSIKKAAEPLLKYIDRYNKATQYAQSYEVRQTRQLLSQAQHYHTQAMQTLPAKENKPLGYIIKQIYALVYRYHGIELPLSQIRKLAAIVIPFDYTDAQINEHLAPAKRQKIKDNIEREKEALAAGVVEYSGSLKQTATPPTSANHTQEPQSDSQKLACVISLIQSCQSLESGDKRELCEQIAQTAQIYQIELDENQA